MADYREAFVGIDVAKLKNAIAVPEPRLLRAGELTAVWVPDEGREAMRDLVRARTTVIAEFAPNWSLASVVRALQALRGVDLIAAVTFVTEVGDADRFESPRQLMVIPKRVMDAFGHYWSNVTGRIGIRLGSAKPG